MYYEQACVNMIESGKGSDVKWGNQVGFIFPPLHIAMHSDPLDYVRKAKNACDRKKSSLEVAFTHEVAEVFFKLLGPKVHIFDPFYYTVMSIANILTRWTSMIYSSCIFIKKKG